MKTLALGAVALALLSIVGCSKSSTDAAPGAVTLTAAPSPKAAEAKTDGKVVNLAKLGLKGAAPGETEDPIIGDGVPAMVMASKFTVNVSEAKAGDPKKIKEAEESAKMYDPKNIKQETLPDGWSLTYMNTGGSLGENYFVTVRREIGGKAYLCETMQSTPDQQKNAVAFCKSLSK